MTIKIRKLFLVMGVILFSTLLFGCVENGKTNTWFSKEVLQNYQIEDLPRIKDKNAVLINDEENVYELYFNSSLDDVNQYVKNVVDYLLGNEQIYNLSICDNFVMIDGNKIWKYKKVDETLLFNRSGYVLAFSIEQETYEKYGYVGLKDAVVISVAYTSETPLNIGYKYTAYIKIDSTSDFVILE